MGHHPAFGKQDRLHFPAHLAGCAGDK